MSSADVLETVLAWHAAVNAGEVEKLVALSTDDIEVGGPRGSGRGVELLRDWVTRAGVQLVPTRAWARADRAVVEQSGRWRAPDGSLLEPQQVASAFRVADGRVASVLRYGDVGTALQAAALTRSDATPV